MDSTFEVQVRPQDNTHKNMYEYYMHVSADKIIDGHILDMLNGALW